MHPDPRPPRLARPRPLALWLALLVAFAPTAVLAQFLSPGPLSRQHREVDGDDDCNRCHAQGEGVPDRLCLDCHRPIKARIDRGKGYHARVTKTERCAKCHRDHLGREAPLIDWPGGGPERFNHAQTGWPLVGGHAEPKCRDCHKAEYRQEGNLPDETYLGLPTDCRLCHKGDDPHKGQFGDRKCESCHVVDSPRKWKGLNPFDHQRTNFPLKDKHAETKCEKCHEQGKFAGVATTCVGCHETPHPKATEFGEKCESCHTAKAWNALTYAKSSHKKFPLEGGHAKPKCTDCHGAKAALAPPEDCVECHKKDDAHKGQFGRKCQSCHQISDWKKLKKGAEIDHDKTAYPLRGEHVTVDCAECHVGGRFKPVAHEKCLDCHKDPHEAKVGTKCEDCHVVAGFKPSLYPLERHVKFALTGAHKAVACNDCHRPAPSDARKPGGGAGKPAAADRTHPPALDFRQGVSACSSCHRDVHEGQFAPRTCDQCHTTAGWFGPAGAGFKHDVWPLTDKHATTACASCHSGGHYAGTPRECRDCHGDPHLGQFIGKPPVQDCKACHTPAAWKGAFDHARVWPLEGVHAQAECKECHKEIHVGDARVTVRWRLGFQDCARCHENVHRQGAAFAKCADCHVPVDWRTMRTGGVDGFDHDPTGFPLRGRHAGEGCTSCHKGEPLRGARCTTCHEDPHQSRNGDRCDACHTSRDWRLPDAVTAHQRGRFPLQGAHLTADCRECHRFAAENVWKGADARCASCHADETRGLHPAHTQPPFTTACDACHTPYSFARAEIDHARWWPLTGVHARTDCGRCHAGERFAGTPRDCARCHADDFARGHEPTEPTGCVNCHSTTAWKPALDFDHDRAFPLPHRGVSACKSCHPATTASFSCMTCHTHSRAEMNGEHDEVRGYVWEARACYRCHPRGRE